MLRRIVAMRISDHAVQELMRLIEDGTLRPGEKLPVERNLASQLGVSRPSVREALRALETLGLVEIRRGLGTFVLRRESPSEAVRRHWKAWVVAHRVELIEVWQARAALEAETAALAAQRATPGDIAGLRELHEEMGRAVAAEDVPAVVVSDFHFHSRIAEMSGNGLLKQLVESALSPIDDRQRPRVFSLPGRPAQSLQEHAEVVTAIAARDPGEAAAAMRRHLRGVIRDVESLPDERRPSPEPSVGRSSGAVTPDPGIRGTPRRG